MKLPAHPPLPAEEASFQERAIGLIERLMDKDEQLLAQFAATQALRRERAAPAQPASDSGFDLPRTRHDWPLAENPLAQPEGMWLYDMRLDDPVILAARAGAAFMDRHALAGEAPDFIAALAELNALARQVPDAPDVSVVIPVHGQLGFTLNALDGLLRHASRFTAEIIVVDDASPDETPLILPLLSGIRYHAQPRNQGFIAACNAGGALATGRFIVMLNNDTRPADGWLDELLLSFQRFPRAGLIGSKLFYPDGSLQEAGGIIWRDGTAWNDGRGDDPNRPRYGYARQVDYVSGCAIALPTPLWRALGGFDAYFSPAYCEDVDLALRVRAAGHEVWMQPQSRLIHYEGKTSGTDTGSGTKAYQLTNTKKLFLRWRDTLSRHRPNGQAPFFEREREVTRRLLVVDSSTPTPDQDAGSLQTRLILQVAMAAGYKVSFVPQDNWLFQPGYTTALQALGVECAYAPFELGFEAYLQRYGALFDAVLVFRAEVMEKCAADIRLFAPQAALLFHVADLHHLRMERSAALSGDAEMAAAAALMKRRELEVIAQADCTITHSAHEAELLAQIAPGAPVAVWPLMAELAGTQTPFLPRRDLCFIGGYRHPPNIDAMQWFVAEIFPLLRAAEPGIRLVIAGSHPPAEIHALAAPDIHIAGWVEALAPLFDAARVFICPLRVGAGVKGKVASALAHGLPVVSTRIGVEGAGLQDGQEVLVADDPADFAAAVLRLYRDEALWRRLSQAGQEFVARELSLATGGRMLNQALDRAYAQKLGLTGPGGTK